MTFFWDKKWSKRN